MFCEEVELSKSPPPSSSFVSYGPLILTDNFSPDKRTVKKKPNNKIQFAPPFPVLVTFRRGDNWFGCVFIFLRNVNPTAWKRSLCLMALSRLAKNRCMSFEKSFPSASMVGGRFRVREDSGKQEIW